MTALSLRDVRKNFGATEIIRGVTLDIQAGERHCIIGPNGAGKTTLFNLISGRFPITSGEIALNGARIDALPPHQINRMGLSRSFQITSIFHRMTVLENVRCGLLWAGRASRRPAGRSASSSASPSPPASRSAAF